jgi:dTDP-4-amino-4,6-dideoxygalactose transaminase
VLEICRERGLLLIEDCAHGMLTTIDGKPAGTFGDGAIFSFYKWVPVPNGAALTFKTGDESLMQPADRRTLTSGVALSAFSMLDSIAMRYGSPGRALRSTVRAAGRRARDVTSTAYVPTGGIDFSDDDLTYAMSGISHHILANQPLDEIARKRRENYEHLAELLGDVAPPLQGRLPHGVTPPFYPTRVLYKTAILDRLKARGVEGRNFWEFHHWELPPGTWMDTDDLRETVMELPIHQDLGPGDIERMAAIVKQTIGTKVIPAPGQYKPKGPEACAVVLRVA